MNPAIILASILGLFSGLVITFFGERIFKISLSGTGFGVGLVLASGIVYNLTENPLFAFIAGIVVGIMSMFLVRSAYRMGLFLIGFAMAAIIVTYISIAMDAVTINIDIQNLENIDPNSIQQMLPLLFTGFLASMITGSLVVILDTPILRVITAIFGATMFSISGYVLTTGMDSLPQSTAQLVGVQLFVWGIGWIPLAIAGGVFQFFGINWLLNFLQMDQASRREKARREAYYASKQKPMNQPQGGYPPQNPQNPYGQQPSQQGYPPQSPNPNRQPPSQDGQLPNQNQRSPVNRPASQRNPQQQRPRKPRP